MIGGLVYDAGKGRFLAVRSPAVIVAAGGLSTLYFPNTDTMRGNTGDSYALAVRAGAELVDMEQVQFLPFCLTYPPSYEGLLAGEPATAGYLGVIRDANGKVILDSVMLRTRAECAAAIVKAVEDGRGTERNGCYLDLTANVKAGRSGVYYKNFLDTAVSGVMVTVRQALGRGAADCKEQWEVRPGAHYSMGGIRVDEYGSAVSIDARPRVKGLYAAGQAMGGLFGANRLGSTSLTEGVVFGMRAGQSAATLARENDSRIEEASFNSSIDEFRNRFGQQGNASVVSLRMDLQSKSWDCIGPIRTAEGLIKIDSLIEEWNGKLDEIRIPADPVWNQIFIDFIELRNMLETARLVSAAAQERDGSLGGHVRLDRPSISAFSQPYSTVVSNNSRELVVSRQMRPRSPLKRLLRYRILEDVKILGAKFLRLMPTAMLDKRLEKKYKSIMGDSGVAPEIMPGGAEGAVGEA